ncbi:MAG TPA: LysR family transcriptional regulator [Roseimicrobium sp.]|nr:LysR family transcriptional regulator [Roseimicrobium sp.]
MAAKKSRTKALRPRFRILQGDEIALGPGKADLLAQVAETGSIAEAAKRMDMSYMRAWTLIRTMNGCFKEPLVESARGGAIGGGARLTETGTRVLALYQQMQEKSMVATRKTWLELSRLLDG